jgi:RNA polymerase sigma-70 factor (ECF subfamily)
LVFLHPFGGRQATYVVDEPPAPGERRLDREDLTRLIRSNQAALYRYVRYLGADRSLAEDICQETFLVAVRDSVRRPAGGACPGSGWLRGVARNLFLSHCRRQRNSPVRIDGDCLARAEALWQMEFLRQGDGSDYIQALQQCLRLLPEDHRRLLQMQYAQGATRAEMARLAGMTEDGIKSAVRRIRARLASCIADRLGLTEGPGK